jgi:hypothetical protein
LVVTISVNQIYWRRQVALSYHTIVSMNRYRNMGSLHYVMLYKQLEHTVLNTQITINSFQRVWSTIPSTYHARFSFLQMTIINCESGYWVSMLYVVMRACAHTTVTSLMLVISSRCHCLLGLCIFRPYIFACITTVASITSELYLL